jgi:hypothetical protein
MPAEPDLRPLWVLAPGGIPLPASSKRLPANIRWQAREGDREWTEIDPGMPPDQICDREGWVIAHKVSRFR